MGEIGLYVFNCHCISIDCTVSRTDNKEKFPLNKAVSCENCLVSVKLGDFEHLKVVLKKYICCSSLETEGRFGGLGSSSGLPKTVLTHRLCMSLVLWTALPSWSIYWTSDPQTVLLDSWTPLPSGSIDSHNPRCSNYIVIVLLLSVHVTSIAHLSVLGRGIPLLRFSRRFLIIQGFLSFSSPGERV